MRKHAVVGLLMVIGSSLGMAGEDPRVQTKLGLYVTAKKAHDMWQADPEAVTILDIRTLAEYVFVGHPPMAYSLPAFFQTHRWDPERGMFAMEPNPEFVAQVGKWVEPDDTILVTCRSGERAAMAINLLAEAGFTRVYNIVDGMEGGIVKDPESVFNGRRMKNGWQNSNLPWTYEINLDQIWIPNDSSSQEESK